MRRRPSPHHSEKEGLRMRHRHRQLERRTRTRRRRKPKTAGPIREQRRGRTLARENEPEVSTERKSHVQLMSAQRSPVSKLYEASNLDPCLPHCSYLSLTIGLTVQPMSSTDYGCARIDGHQRRLACWQSNSIRMRLKPAEFEHRHHSMLGLRTSRPALMTHQREEALPSPGLWDLRLSSIYFPKIIGLSLDIGLSAAQRRAICI